MSDNNTLYAAMVAAIIVLVLIWNGQRSGAKMPFPPGPKGLPFLGNILDIPGDVPIWQTFTTVAEKFSMSPPTLSFLNSLLKQPSLR